MILPPDVESFIKQVSKNYGNVKIVPKSSSKLMRLIGWLFSKTKISPEFMTKYITTIGDTIYWPDQGLVNPDSESMLRVVVHETVHVADSKRFTSLLFSFLYLFPQSLAALALLSLLAVWKIQFLWCLLFLLFLAPIPAPFRYWFELRAYRTSLMFAKLEDKQSGDELIPIYEWIEGQLCTQFYYWTWPFPKLVRKNLMEKQVNKDQIYKDINCWLFVRKLKKTIASGT
jgi:hypothetical protein